MVSVPDEMAEKRVPGAQNKRVSIPFPNHLGNAEMDIEVKPSTAMSSSPVAVISFLDRGTGNISPGCQRMLYFNRESLSLQASSTSNMGTSIDGFSDWLINLVVERQEFLTFHYQRLNEFVSMSVAKRSELINMMRPTAVAILSSVRNLCMRVHIVAMSVSYAKGIGGADLSSEDMAALWNQRIVADVMES